MEDDESEYKSLLDQEKDFNSLLRNKKHRRSYKTYLLYIYVVILSLYSCFVSLVQYHFLSKHDWNILAIIKEDSISESASLSPLAAGLSYIQYTPPRDYWDHSIYFGEPSDESEKAWNHILRPGRHIGIQITPEEAASVNIVDSLRLPNGNFATLPGFGHNLHCLRRIREAYYSEHYYPNATEEEMKENRMHDLHCMEAIRTSVMCKPDLAPLPYWWSGTPGHEVNASPDVARKCVNWDRLQESLKPRGYSFDLRGRKGGLPEP